jgi:sulfite exporter TauE/SafE
MSILEFGVVFGLGVVSSIHCLQMCGPVVLAYSLPLSKGGRRLLPAHLAYNAGRILVYMLLGAMAGALGSTAGMLGRLAGITNGARIFAGVAMIAAGVAMAGSSKGLVTIGGGGMATWFSRSIGRLILAAHPAGKFGLGLILGFLPCGLVYGALLKAVDAGAAIPGALTMLAFGLGTSLALLGVGLVAGKTGRILGPWSNRLAAASLMLLGAFLLWRGIAAPAASCHVAS